MTPYDPTPEEIAEHCLGIQATWSESERAKRCCVKAVQWTAPTVAIEDDSDREL